MDVPCTLMGTRARQPVVTGGVASIPSRAWMLREMVVSILPQVDRLAVYLNQYDEVPAFLDDPRITVARSQDHGDRGDAGKFFAAGELTEGVYLSLDDDIVYPPDYAARMVDRLVALDGKAVVGVHGVVYARRPTSFFDRRVLQFPEANARLRPVSLVGTGTAGFDLERVPISPSIFRSGSMADLWFGVHLKQLGVPVVCIDRPADWLQPIPPTRVASLWRAAVSESGPHERLVRSAEPWGRADLVERARRSGCSAIDLPDWLAVPDLVDANSDLADFEVTPSGWPGVFPPWNDRWLPVYFDELEQLELARAAVHQGQSVEGLAPVLTRAAGASLPAAVECAAAARAAVAPESPAARALEAAHLQLLRRAGRSAEALEAYDGADSTALPVERERVLALLEAGRPDDAHAAAVSSRETAGLAALVPLARALRSGGDALVRAAAGIAGPGSTWDLRRPLVRWLRSVDPPEEARSTLELGELTAAGEQDGFEHVAFVRALQALGWVELSRFWLCRFGHRLGGAPYQPMGRMLAAQLQPSAADARRALNELWRAAGLAEAHAGEDAAVERWVFGESPGAAPATPTDEPVAVVVAVGPADDPAGVGLAIASLQTQREVPVEIVVVASAAEQAALAVGDGATDLRFVDAGDVAGRYARRNLGRVAANRRIIAFADVGQWAHPQRLAHQLQLMAGAGAPASVAPCFRFDERGVPTADLALPPLGDVAGTLVVERSLLDRVGGFCDVKSGADEEMLGRLERAVGFSAVARAMVPLVLSTSAAPAYAAEEPFRTRFRRAHYFGMLAP